MSKKCRTRMVQIRLALFLIIVLVLSIGVVTNAKTTVVYWQHFADARIEAVQQLAAEFMKENPDIEIQIEGIPWAAYFDKLFTSIAAGSGPDVFQAPTGLAEQFIRSGNIVPLRGISPSQVEEEFLPWTVERLISEGKIWGLPTDIQSIVLFYNTRLFKEAGLDPDRPPASWEELVHYGQKLTKQEGGRFSQTGLDTDYYSIVLETFMFQAGVGKMYDDDLTQALFNTPEALRALTFMTDLTTRYGIEDAEFNSQDNTFALELTAMSLAHPVSMGTLRLFNPALEYKVALAPPVNAGDTPVTTGTHWQYFITKKAPQLEAQKWVEYLASEHAQLTFCQVAGDLVSRKALLTNPIVRTNPNQAVALDSLEYARPISWPGWAEFVRLYTEAIERVVFGQNTPEESLDILIREINGVLANR